ncbi:hypothetical protein K439DRAFT_49698 [Ramaria rubella]|nr:hypothetical protein K439DRAFT_49698 [Ramaria rubella]
MNVSSSVGKAPEAWRVPCRAARRARKKWTASCGKAGDGGVRKGDLCRVLGRGRRWCRFRRRVWRSEKEAHGELWGPTQLGRCRGWQGGVHPLLLRRLRVTLSLRRRLCVAPSLGRRLWMEWMLVYALLGLCARVRGTLGGDCGCSCALLTGAGRGRVLTCNACHGCWA